ncbi:hypothetical protein OH76DRAFT_1083479 [Lentinus brumalis]|uniref:Uncharacterized protein n=1 Tax=Lentinus brumalis TaxID=2498619 RepID=A0A371DP56_9APHY|nr:hypothetical protein OH76DRAFT_1083479 [Polyporus brumalis]
MNPPTRRPRRLGRTHTHIMSWIPIPMTPHRVMPFTLAHAFSCTPYFLYSAKSPSLSPSFPSRRIVPWLIVCSRTFPACVYYCHLYFFSGPRGHAILIALAASNTIGFRGIDCLSMAMALLCIPFLGLLYIVSLPLRHQYSVVFLVCLDRGAVAAASNVEGSGGFDLISISPVPGYVYFTRNHTPPLTHITHLFSRPSV